MRISSINAYAPSFGQIRKSAVLNAIDDAKGDITKLNLLRDLIEEQRDNHSYDVMYRYEVVKNSSGSHEGWYHDIQSACQKATKLLEDDKKRIQEEERIIQEQERINRDKPRFDKLAQEILDSCEE